MNKRILVALGGLLLALIGVFGANRYVKANLKEVEVVTVKQEIPAYTQITQDMLTTKTVGANGLDANVIKDSKQLIGKYTTTKLIPGDLILPGKISDINEVPQGYLYTIKPEDRIVAIPTDLTKSAGGTVKKGDYVDLIVILKSNNGPSSAKLFLQHIPVIDVRDPDANQLGAVKKDEEGKIIATNQKKVPGAIVVAVKPDQAEKIALYSEVGKIFVAVNPRDYKPVNTPGFTLGAAAAAGY
ncbi:Flp pilus assembly protein CpaB (plasmid) [Carboxydocella thermautotrophica]|nr:Flp pilus assembly protein CpaB [Carboxydocella thermautotrophica]